MLKSIKGKRVMCVSHRTNECFEECGESPDWCDCSNSVGFCDCDCPVHHVHDNLDVSAIKKITGK